MVKVIFLGYVLRAGGGWSDDLMTTDYEDLQESEVAAIYVRRFTNQEFFVQRENKFLCANGTQRLSCRPRPSLIAEGNLEPGDDVEIEDGDTKESTTEDSWSMRRKFIVIMKNFVWSFTTQVMK